MAESFKPAERSGLTPAQHVELRGRMGYGHDVQGVGRFNAFLQAESRRRSMTIGPLIRQLWGETMDPVSEFGDLV